MKHATEHQLLELFDPSDNQKAVAFGKLRKISSDAEFNDFDSARQLGRFKSKSIALDGEALYVVFYQVDAFGGIYVAAAAGISAKENFEVLIQGVQQIAHLAGTKRISFHTDRLALVHKTKKFGWRVTKVLLEKR